MKHINTKRIFALIAFISLATSYLLSAENGDTINILGIIDIHGSLELGYLLRAGDLITHYNNNVVTAQNIYNYDYKPYFDLGLYLTFYKVLNVGGSIRSVFSVDNAITYMPLLDKYSVFVELFLYNHIHVGFSHYCEHTSMPYFVFDNLPSVNTLDRSEEKLYLRFEF
jgi:hypothetical protein